MSEPALQLTRHQRQALRTTARAKLAVDNLADFVRQAWPVLEPGKPLRWNWHIDVICAELEAVAAGGFWGYQAGERNGAPFHVTCNRMHPDATWIELRELVICIPPRMLKSRIVSVCFQAWMWLRAPGLKVISLSNDDSLAIRDSREMRELIRSPWYRALVELIEIDRGGQPEDAWGLAQDQAQKKNFENTFKGYRIALSVGGSILGKGADGIIVDDPYDAKKVTRGGVENVAKHMAAIVTDYDGVWRSRLNEPATGWRVTIMQRLHEDDLAGCLIRRGVRCVVLPQEFDPEFPDKFGGVYQHDPRTEAGELLMANRYTPEVIAEIKATPGAAKLYATMHGQRPTPEEGLKFKRDWFRKRYEGEPHRVALGLDEILISVDCAAKKGEKRSRTAMGAWGREGKGKFFLLDLLVDWLEFHELGPAFRGFCAKWPRARKKLIEDASNGTALISQETKRGTHGIIAVSPHGGSKEERANHSEVAHQAGQVFLPDPEYLPQVGEYIEEHCQFPEGSRDDIVDMTSQAINEWVKGEPDPLEKIKRRYAVLDQ